MSNKPLQFETGDTTEYQLGDLKVSDQMQQYMADQIYSIDIPGRVTNATDVVMLTLFECMEFERLVGMPVTEFLNAHFPDEMASPAKFDAQFPD